MAKYWHKISRKSIQRYCLSEERNIGLSCLLRLRLFKLCRLAALEHARKHLQVDVVIETDALIFQLHKIAYSVISWIFLLVLEKDILVQYRFLTNEAKGTWSYIYNEIISKSHCCCNTGFAFNNPGFFFTRCAPLQKFTMHCFLIGYCQSKHAVLL